MRHCKDLIDSYIEFTSGHESTDRVRKWSFISVIAGVMERRLFLPRGYYVLFPNLYVFIIGKSGLIKKSTSTAIAVNILREIQGIRMMSERLTAGSLIKQMASSGKTFEWNDLKIKQSPLYIYASELAVFMDTVFGNITELLTTFYDCQPNDSEKPWTHNTVGDGATNVYGPCLNMLGASTKAWLTKCIPKTEMEGGFTSRIVFVVENKLPKNLVAWPQLNEDIYKLRGKIVADLHEIYNLKGAFTVDHHAKMQFERWYKHHMTVVLPRNMDARMVGYMSRKGDTILKLAMIKSVSESNDLVLTTEHIRWAEMEMDDIEGDWRDAFDGVAVKTGISWELRAFIANRGQASKKEILEGFSSQYSQKEILQELMALSDMGEIVDVPSISGLPAGFRISHS